MDIRDIHVGDLLILRDDLIEGGTYGVDGIVDENADWDEEHWCRAMPEMIECSDQIMTVTHIDQDFYISILGVYYDNGDEALFAPSMFKCHAEEWFHDTVRIADEALNALIG